MSWSIDNLEDAIVVRISQDVHLSDQPEFERFLEDELGSKAGKIVLDIAGVTALCSAALGNIVKIHKRAREAGGAVVFINVDTKVQRLLDITRISRVMQILPSRAAALEYLSSLD